MRSWTRSLLRRAAALVLAALVAAPELAGAIEAPAEARSVKSLDAMSQSELDAFVQQINESSNWRKYRRPGDPPDFVPGKPVRVMHGAGAAFGRGGRGGNLRSFRKSGLGSQRSGLGGRSRGGRDDQMASDRNRNSRSSSSSNSRSSFGSNRSSFGNNGSSFGNGSGLDQ